MAIIATYLFRVGGCGGRTVGRWASYIDRSAAGCCIPSIRSPRLAPAAWVALAASRLEGGFFAVSTCVARCCILRNSSPTRSPIARSTAEANSRAWLVFVTSFSVVVIASAASFSKSSGNFSTASMRSQRGASLKSQISGLSSTSANSCEFTTQRAIPHCFPTRA